VSYQARVSHSTSAHPRSCFFEQSQLQRLFGDDFFQRAGFVAQALYLAVVAARAVSPASRRLPASRNSCDRASYMVSTMPSRRHSSAILASPRRPLSTMRILSSEETELWPNLGDDGLRKAAYRGGWKPA
jgi:hypothetical protein